MDPYIRLPRAQIVTGRQGFVLARCKDKRVLHLGCVDAGLVHERFRHGELMHQKLAAVASELWGVDIDADGISFLKSQGFGNLVIGDICELDKIEALKGQHFDVVVASEVIEHLENPGLFLRALRAIAGYSGTELVVTVPNAFRIATLTCLLRGVEYIHPDHNYWFSYHTVTNLLRKCGFEIKEVLVYSFQPFRMLPDRIRRSFEEAGPSAGVILESTELSQSASALRRAFVYVKSLPWRLAVSFLYKRSPFWGDGIIIVASVAVNG